MSRRFKLCRPLIVLLSLCPPAFAQVNQLTFDLPTRGAAYWTTTDAAAPLVTGYSRLKPAAGRVTPNSMAIFSSRTNGVLVSEAAVAAARQILQGRIYAEIDGPVDTGIAIANANNQPVTIGFYFADAAGAQFGSGATSIPANGQIAAFLDQPPFVPSSPESLSRARTFTFTSNLPVGAIALRSYTNERSDFLMTTLPVAQTNGFLLGTAMLPMFVDGGGWRTQILLMNPNDTTIRGDLWLGSQFFPYLIMPRSAARFATSGLGSTIASGTVHVLPNATPAPVSSAVFSFVQSGVTVSQTGVPLTASSTSWSLFAENGDAKTGLGLANTDPNKAATVAFEVLDMNGQATGDAGSITIPALAQTSLFIDQIPGLEHLPSRFRGILHVTSPDYS